MDSKQLITVAVFGKTTRSTLIIQHKKNVINA